MAERLLNDNARPVAVFFFGQAHLPELLHDGREKSRRNGEVEEAISSRIVLLIDIGNLLRQALVRVRILKITLDIVNALGEPGPYCGVDLRRGIFWDFFRQRFAESFRVEVVAGETDDGELFGEQIIGCEVAQRRDQLALRKVAGSAEDHHHAGRGDRIWVRMVHENPLVRISFPRGRRIENAWPTKVLRQIPLRCETRSVDIALR